MDKCQNGGLFFCFKTQQFHIQACIAWPYYNLICFYWDAIQWSLKQHKEEFWHLIWSSKVIIWLHCLTIHTPSSVSILSILVFIHFLSWGQGEFRLTIKRFFSWWSFLLFPWPWYGTQGWNCREKLEANHYSKGSVHWDDVPINSRRVKSN